MPIEEDPQYQWYRQRIKTLTHQCKRLNRRNPALHKARAERSFLIQKLQQYKATFDGKASQYGEF